MKRRFFGSAATLLLVLTIPTPGNPGAQVPESIVWEQVSPCLVTRQEWYTVATTPPGEVGSESRWEPRTPSIPFSAAMAEADTRKMETRGFFNDLRCCRHFGVYEEAETRRLWVFNHVTAQVIPARFMPVQINMCCEEAANLAKFPPAMDCRALKLADGRMVMIGPGRQWQSLSSPASMSLFDEMAEIAKQFPVGRADDPVRSGQQQSGVGSADCRTRIPQAVLQQFTITACNDRPAPGTSFGIAGAHFGVPDDRSSSYRRSRRQTYGPDGRPVPATQPDAVNLLSFEILESSPALSLGANATRVAGIGDHAQATGLGGGGNATLVFWRGRYAVRLKLTMWAAGEAYMLDLARQLDAAIQRW